MGITECRRCNKPATIEAFVSKSPLIEKQSVAVCEVCFPKLMKACHALDVTCFSVNEKPMRKLLEAELGPYGVRLNG